LARDGLEQNRGSLHHEPVGVDKETPVEANPQAGDCVLIKNPCRTAVFKKWQRGIRFEPCKNKLEHLSDYSASDAAPEPP
jgi:hypothetical protein